MVTARDAQLSLADQAVRDSVHFLVEQARELARATDQEGTVTAKRG